MAFRRNRPQRHGCRIEAASDRFHRLHLGEGNGRLRTAENEKIAHEAAVAAFNPFAKVEVVDPIQGTGETVQGKNRLRGEIVVLATRLVAVEAAHLKGINRGQVGTFEDLLVLPGDALLDLGVAEPRQMNSSAGEALGTDLAGKADDIE